MADQYGLIPLPFGVPFDPEAAEQDFQPALPFGGFASGWVESGASAQTLTAGVYANSNGFYAATVAPGTVALTASLYSSANTFYDVAVTSLYALAPTLYSNTSTFYSATATARNSVSPARLDNTQSFYGTTVSATYALAPTRYDNAAAFYSPAVSAVPTLSPSLYADGDTFFTATAAAFNSLLPGLYSDGDGFYAASITTSSTLQAGLYSDADSFFAATIAPGPFSIDAQTVVNSATIFLPVVALEGAESERKAQPVAAGPGSQVLLSQMKRKHRMPVAIDDDEEAIALILCAMAADAHSMNIRTR